jgi:hypothetical protein
VNDSPTHPLFIALTATIEHLKAGDIHEAEVQHDWCVGERQDTLTITVRRFSDAHVRLALEADDDG